MTVQEALQALSAAHQKLVSVTPAWIGSAQPPSGDLPALPQEYEDALVALQAAIDDYESARSEDGGDAVETPDTDSTGTGTATS